jgi:hypothetical protein
MIMTAAILWSVKQPDRMESHLVHRHLAPLCPLQELDTGESRHVMCDASEEEEQRVLLHTDPGTCRLNDLFVRAHGVPQGEYTIFSSALDITAVPPGHRAR